MQLLITREDVRPRLSHETFTLLGNQYSYRGIWCSRIKILPIHYWTWSYVQHRVYFACPRMLHSFRELSRGSGVTDVYYFYVEGVSTLHVMSRTSGRGCWSLRAFLYRRAIQSDLWQKRFSSYLAIEDRSAQSTLLVAAGENSKTASSSKIWTSSASQSHSERPKVLIRIPSSWIQVTNEVFCGIKSFLIVQKVFLRILRIPQRILRRRNT